MCKKKHKRGKLEREGDRERERERERERVSERKLEERKGGKWQNIRT